ncbi:AAA family ATPase [Salmonella enterica]|nr:AAA family ATPase [Salmonella enterica]ELG7717160.1 AAA family ATPase [Salmonella enterica]ELH0823313.1 AAA family ATPase [Salmonella enterica]
MNNSTQFNPLEADYSAAYGVYLAPRGEVNPGEKKRPVSTNEAGNFSILNPATWLTFEAAENHCSRLNLLEEVRTNYNTVVARAMAPYEVCLDFDPVGDEQSAEAATWVMSFKDARIERSVSGGFHVIFRYNSPAIFPGKLQTPNGLKIDVKRGYYPVSPDEFAGGSALTIGEPLNDKEAAAELTERDYKTITALLHVCGKVSAPDSASSANGFKASQTPAPRENAPESGAQAQIERISTERPGLYAVLCQPLDEESTAPGFAGVTGSDKLARIIAELYEVTGNEADTIAVLLAAPAGQHENASANKRDKYRTATGYQKFLAKDVQRVIAKKQGHDAAKTAGVSLNLPDANAQRSQATSEPAEPGRFTYSSYTEEETPEDTTVIVEGLLSAGVCYMYGASKSYKSFFAIGLCGAIAKKTGYFNGRRVAGGNAVYIAAEAPKTLPKRRFAWAQEYNNGQPLPNWHTVKSRFNFADPRELAGVVNMFDSMIDSTGEPIRLIVIDTFSRTFAGNENSTDDAMKFHNGVDTLAQRYDCAVLVIHHSGKDEARGMRGSSSLYAAADNVIVCKRGKDLSIELELDKTKIGADGERLTLPLKSVKLPPQFNETLRNNTAFTTQPDPHREALRKSKFAEADSTLVLIDDPDSAATQEQQTKAAFKRVGLSTGGKKFNTINEAVLCYMGETFSAPAALKTICNNLPEWAAQNGEPFAGLHKQNKVQDALNALCSSGELSRSGTRGNYLYVVTSHGGKKQDGGAVLDFTPE